MDKITSVRGEVLNNICHPLQMNEKSKTFDPGFFLSQIKDVVQTFSRMLNISSIELVTNNKRAVQVHQDAGALFHGL